MHGNDTEKQIFFYEHEFYVFSNYSSFMLEWKGKLYPTSEHAYHSEKFEDEKLKEELRNTRSAHDSQKFANANKDKRRSDWDDVKLGIMKEILKEKVLQHPYVMKKLIDSGQKELVEDSWRDNYWGWGPNKDGENHLGKLWMEVRDELVRN
ncbi:NADAR family protein [Candidatus Gracilibacteria bacterium]|nr:NADAR family protein [Candidatus Gracilibacteria bacterium]MCF7898888.1 NADAR family protein [Candidatus Paceibacterota bacterium]